MVYWISRLAIYFWLNLGKTKNSWILIIGWKWQLLTLANSTKVLSYTNDSSFVLNLFASIGFTLLKPVASLNSLWFVSLNQFIDETLRIPFKFHKLKDEEKEAGKKDTSTMSNKCSLVGSKQVIVRMTSIRSCLVVQFLVECLFNLNKGWIQISNPISKQCVCVCVCNSCNIWFHSILIMLTLSQIRASIRNKIMKISKKTRIYFFNSVDHSRCVRDVMYLHACYPLRVLMCDHHHTCIQPLIC